MQIRTLIIALFLLSGVTRQIAQTPLTYIFADSPREELGFFADVMYNAVSEEHRGWAAEKFERMLNEFIISNKITELATVPWIQAKYPSDSSFVLATWQYLGKDDVFIPSGLIAYAGGDIKQLKYTTESWEDPEYQSFSCDEWPGAVYYQMIPFESNAKDTLWLLFGYNGWDSKTRIRVLEVLDMRVQNPRFGSDVFVMKDDPVRPDRQYRKILKYAAQSDVRIVTDDSLGLIVMDHLIPATTPDGQLTYVPDGSYEAFEYRDGYWYFVEKVFDQTQDVPPGNPSVEPEKRDLFGRKL